MSQYSTLGLGIVARHLGLVNWHRRTAATKMPGNCSTHWH